MRRLCSLAALTLIASIAPAWAQGSVSNIKYPTVNQSTGISVGGTFQTILPAVTATRRSITIQNNNLTHNCWIFIGPGPPTPNTTNSILLTPGGSYSRYYPYIPFDVIQGTCTSNGDTLYVDVQ